MPESATELYVCPRCFSAEAAPGPCPDCGVERERCDPGDPDNPCRRPPLDAAGRMTSRAPLWWLARSVPHLREQLKQWRTSRKS